MTSPDCVAEPPSSGGGGSSSGDGGVSGGVERSFFGQNGLCYSSVDRDADRAQPQLATFSSPPPIFSTPCR